MFTPTVVHSDYLRICPCGLKMPGCEAYLLTLVSSLRTSGAVILRPCMSSCPSQWQRAQRRVSAAACLLKLWVRIPRGLWMSVCCEFSILSGRDLSVGLITDSEGVVLSVVCLSVIAKPRKGKPWPQDGPKRRRNGNKMSS